MATDAQRRDCRLIDVFVVKIGLEMFGVVKNDSRAAFERIIVKLRMTAGEAVEG